MLILGRGPGQNIRIGSNIELRVLEVSGNQVKLGIVAPKEVQVLREELLNQPHRSEKTPR